MPDYAYDRRNVVYSVASFDAPDGQIDVVLYGCDLEPLAVRRFVGDALDADVDVRYADVRNATPVVADWLRDVVAALLDDDQSSVNDGTRWIY